MRRVPTLALLLLLLRFGESQTFQGATLSYWELELSPPLPGQAWGCSTVLPSLSPWELPPGE